MSSKKNDQAGIVSLFVTMIMMVVISLIVLSFGQVARRNARIQLDNQNGVQAYYAAESGINDALGYIKQNPSVTVDTTSCNDFMSRLSTAGYSANLSSDRSVAYSCVLASTTPQQLDKSPLNVDETVAWPLKDATGGTPASFTFTWKAADGVAGAGCPSFSGSFLPASGAGGWKCQFGLLRVDLVRLPDGADQTVATDTSRVRTLYLVPQTTAGGGMLNLDFTPSATSTYVRQPVQCGTTCSQTVIVGGGSGTYYARFSMVYQPTAQLSVKGSVLGARGLSIKFAEAQATIDATGRAVDQTKRIREVVSLSSNNDDTPTFGVTSTTSFCKLLAVDTTSGNTPLTSSCP